MGIRSSHSIKLRSAAGNSSVPIANQPTPQKLSVKVAKKLKHRIVKQSINTDETMDVMSCIRKDLLEVYGNIDPSKLKIMYRSASDNILEVECWVLRQKETTHMQTEVEFKSVFTAWHQADVELRYNWANVIENNEALSMEHMSDIETKNVDDLVAYFKDGGKPRAMDWPRMINKKRTVEYAVGKFLRENIFTDSPMGFLKHIRLDKISPDSYSLEFWRSRDKEKSHCQGMIELDLDNGAIIAYRLKSLERVTE